MTLIAVTYCTETDLQNRFSPATVIGWADQTETNTEYPNTIDDAINQARQEIEGLAAQQYSQAGLQSCPLINRWCVTLAAYYASTTRGNPAPNSIALEYERIMARLQAIADNEYQLPGIPKRSDSRPTMSNLRVDRRYIQSKVRVQQETSTNSPSTLTQNLDDQIPQGSV
jgi:phage gp36-like protein